MNCLLIYSDSQVIPATDQDSILPGITVHISPVHHVSGFRHQSNRCCTFVHPGLIAEPIGFVTRLPRQINNGNAILKFQFVLQILSRPRNGDSSLQIVRGKNRKRQRKEAAQFFADNSSMHLPPKNCL